MLPAILLLLLVALVLIVLETFLPLGIVGAIGWVLVGLSAYLCVREYGWGLGLAYLAASSVLAFSFWLTAFLAVSRRLALAPPETGEESDGPGKWVGARGVVAKALNPTGYVEIEGKRHSARGEMSNVEIPRGTEVVVSGADGPYLVVKATDDAP